MLVLSRKTGDRVVIDENIVITVVEIRGDKVRLGIEAPRDKEIVRQELIVELPVVGGSVASNEEKETDATCQSR